MAYTMFRSPYCQKVYCPEDMILVKKKKTLQYNDPSPLQNNGPDFLVRAQILPSSSLQFL